MKALFCAAFVFGLVMAMGAAIQSIDSGGW